MTDVQMKTYTQKQTLLEEVEKIFTDKMYKSRSVEYQINQNICCNESDENDIIGFGDIIKTDKNFNMLSFKDIYILF